MLPLWGFVQLNETLSMEALLLAWVFGLLVAVLCGVLWAPVTWSQLACAQVPAQFFRQALKILPKILLGTLALRAFFSLDRLVAGYGFDVSLLAAYGFFVAVASAYLAVIDAGILSRLFPLLVAAADVDKLLAQKYCRKMEISAILSGVIAWAIYLMLIDQVIAYIGKPHFLAYKQLGSLILISYVVYAASMGAHYVMYGRKQDLQIMGVHVFSMLPFALLSWLAIHWSQPELIAWGVLLAMSLQFGLKRYFSQRYE
jgi:hypothetical protein